MLKTSKTAGLRMTFSSVLNRAGSDPGSGQLAEAFFGQGEAVAAIGKVALVDVDGIELLDALEACGPELVFQLFGAEEEAEGLACSVATCARPRGLLLRTVSGGPGLSCFGGEERSRS